MTRRTILFLLATPVAVFVAAVAAYHLRYDPLPSGVTADHVILDKGKRQLTLMSDGAVLKRYSVSLGREPVGLLSLSETGSGPITCVPTTNPALVE